MGLHGLHPNTPAIVTNDCAARPLSEGLDKEKTPSGDNRDFSE